jgi:hypothetical protein
MEKQTAVQWLIEQKRKFHAIINDDLEKALAMEKEQAFEFWKGGIACTEEGGKSFEQYYTQTFTEPKND